MQASRAKTRGREAAAPAARRPCAPSGARQGQLDVGGILGAKETCANAVSVVASLAADASNVARPPRPKDGTTRDTCLPARVSVSSSTQMGESAARMQKLVPRLMLAQMQIDTAPRRAPASTGQVAAVDLGVSYRHVTESGQGLGLGRDCYRDVEEVGGGNERSLAAKGAARVESYSPGSDDLLAPATEATADSHAEPLLSMGLRCRHKASVSRQIQEMWHGRGGMTTSSQGERKGAGAAATACDKRYSGRSGEAADAQGPEVHASNENHREHGSGSANISLSRGMTDRLQELEKENARLKEEAAQRTTQGLSRLQQLEEENARLKAALEEEGRRCAAKQSGEGQVEIEQTADGDASVNDSLEMRVEAMAMFRVLDADNDGWIGKAELVKGFPQHRAVLEEQVDLKDEAPFSFEDFWAVIVAGDMQTQVEAETERLLLLRLAEEEEVARARHARHEGSRSPMADASPLAQQLLADDGVVVPAKGDGSMAHESAAGASAEEDDGCSVARAPGGSSATPDVSLTPDVSFRGVRCQSMDTEIAEQRRQQSERERANVESREAAERNILEMQRRIFDPGSQGALRENSPTPGDPDRRSAASLLQEQEQEQEHRSAAREAYPVNQLFADGVSPRYRSLSGNRSRENSPRVLPHHVIAVCGMGQRHPALLQPASETFPASTHQVANSPAAIGVTSDGDCRLVADEVVGGSEQQGERSATSSATKATSAPAKAAADCEAEHACAGKPVMCDDGVPDALRRLELEISKLEKLETGTPHCSPLPPPSEAGSPPALPHPAQRQKCIRDLMDSNSDDNRPAHEARPPRVILDGNGARGRPAASSNKSNAEAQGSHPSRLDSSDERASSDDDRTPIKQGISFSSRLSRGLPVLQASGLASSSGGTRGVLVSAGKGKGTPSTPPPRHRPHTALSRNHDPNPACLGHPLGMSGLGADGLAGNGVGAGFINGRARRVQEREQELGCQQGGAASQVQGVCSQARVAAPSIDASPGEVAACCFVVLSAAWLARLT